MKKFYGNYVGIVVQNNDPEKAGKVKVFVPHVSATVYKKWVEQKTNKKFKFVGANIDSVIVQSLSGTPNSQTNNLTEIIEELKIVLPWANCAAPLTSENTSGRFNDFHNFANISDSNHFSTFTQSTTSGIDTPGKPAFFYEKEQNRLSDAFVNASENINRPNPLAYDYTPSSYSNRAKGSFGVPTVGSHVWVFFREGNPTLPVYFAVSYGEMDWKGIYDSYETSGMDYPGKFENVSKSFTSEDVNVQTYRNKYVLNQKGGTLEIINTDLNEKLKLTHYSGSFKEFNNQANIELATGNDQKLVLNDSYETVRGFKNQYTEKNLDEIVKRDKFKKIGSLNTEYFEKWKDIYAPVQDLKQLFEIQRATNNNVKDSFGNVVINRNSLQQERVGTFTSHPAIDQTNYTLDDDSSLVNTVITQTQAFLSNSFVDGPSLFSIISKPPQIAKYPNMDSYTQESGIQWVGIPGQSTSSENGNWVIDPKKDLIKQFTEKILPELTEIEKQLGIGGSEIIQITKHKIETIGMTLNNYGSIRFDNVGKMLSSEVLIDNYGPYLNFEPSPLVEYVHVQDLPGGDYTLNVCNRFNVMVGAGGINFKSLGSVNISGTVTNVVGEQVNVSSENEVNLNAKIINISAEILRLRNKRQRQVLIESSLGVNNNLVIGGGLSVEGEVYLQHVTAPAEYQVTQGTQVFSTLLEGTSIDGTLTIPQISVGLVAVTPNGTYPVIGSLTTNATLLVNTAIPNCIASQEHSHIFKNLPLTLLDKNTEVREAAKEMNNNLGRVLPNRRVHGQK